MRKVKSSGQAVTIKYTFKNGEIEQDVKLPGHFAVCPRCEGRGKHVNPSIDEHGISPEEFAEDPDFEEAYFSGRYDVRCYECNGDRVVSEVDESRLTKFQKILWAAHQYRLSADASYEAECAAERRMGA